MQKMPHSFKQHPEACATFTANMEQAVLFEQGSGCGTHMWLLMLSDGGVLRF
jgi:hypothetical protein